MKLIQFSVLKTFDPELRTLATFLPGRSSLYSFRLAIAEGDGFDLQNTKTCLPGPIIVWTVSPQKVWTISLEMLCALKQE